MSGHSHWAGIKRKKEVNDKKRAQVFSKLLAAISVAAKEEANPQFNARLKSAIEKAKENKVPQDNIDRAISKASEQKDLEDILIEAYGPEGSALIIVGITDNKNRTISEIKKILKDHDTKFAEQGSVRWAFSPSNEGWTPNFIQKISEEANTKLMALMEELDDHPDIQDIYLNIEINEEE